MLSNAEGEERRGEWSGETDKREEKSERDEEKKKFRRRETWTDSKGEGQRERERCFYTTLLPSITYCLFVLFMLIVLVHFM